VTQSGRPSVITSLVRQAVAEFRKIAAARVTLAFLLALPVGTFLFAFEIFQVEDAYAHMEIPGMFHALPVLYFSAWKAMLFQAALVAFAAFWMTIDSQYGMIRVACAQPVSRTVYLVGRWMGIGAHVAILSVVFAFSLILWGTVYAGLGDVGAGQVAPLARFTGEVAWFSVALAGVGMVTASFRRTVGSGIVTAAIAIILLAFTMMIPFDVVPPQFLFMRYFFFPLGELPNPWPTDTDSPFIRLRTIGEFLAVVPATPLVLSVLAVLHFRTRDITE
jgi:ABC-type transport system involved in multi-copper enzyme maturation permease subunit